jgi:hypothetical protein
MIEIQAPNEYNYTGTKIFLGGSLSLLGDWRADFIDDLSDTNYIFLNPRRDDVDTFDWDSPSEVLNNLIRWVNDDIQDTDIIVLYFQESVNSPVSILDLADLMKYKNVYVGADENFWKRSLINTAEIEFNFPLYDNINMIIQKLRGLYNANND